MTTVAELKPRIREICQEYITGKIGPGLMMQKISIAIREVPNHEANRLADWISRATEI